MRLGFWLDWDEIDMGIRLGDLQSGACKLSCGTDFGFDCPHGGLQSGGLQSGGVQSCCSEFVFDCAHACPYSNKTEGPSTQALFGETDKQAN